jgi:DNA-directed RNA polymerase subunit RPC12/RpoP
VQATPGQAAPVSTPARIAPPPPKAPASPAAKGAKVGQKLRCPKCKLTFMLESAERPIKIQCPHCGAKGQIS